MGIRVINLRDAVFRIYDETAVTPLYVICPFLDGSMSFPVAPPRPEDTIVLNQGLADANMHYVIESDEAVLAPIEVPLTFMLEASVNCVKVMQAMSNPWQEATWQPVSTTFAPAATLGARIGANGQSITCKLPVDGRRAISCVHVEVFAANPDGSADDFGYRFQGVYFRPPEVSFGNPTGTFETTMEVYGSTAKISAFTTGAAQ